MKSKIKILAASTTLLVFLSPAALAGSDSTNTAALVEKIERLEQRIATLESARTFTQFMPGFSERFHVLHRAGEAGDWAVAAHELTELKRLMSLAPAIDAEKGQLMIAMLGPSMDELKEIIEKGDKQAFNKTLVGTVNTCNACHVATNSPFIEVKLDARDSLGMRHPHKLTAREAPAGHGHGMSAEKSGEHADATPHGEEKQKKKTHQDEKPHD